VRLWEVNNRIQHLFYGHSAAVRTVAISPDGQTFASGSLDKCIKIWDLQGDLRQTIECEHDILSISFSPDGKALAVGSGDNAIALWSMGTNPQLQQTLVGHSTAVWTVDFSPDGQKVVSGSGDKLVKIWQIDGAEI
jgi:WD40 repeat protein